LEVGRDLATAAGVDVRFVESELYAVPEVLGAEFDLVYTGVGALIWLPDIAGWARVAAALLRPGGRLYVRDGHPMLYTLFDGVDDDVLRVTQPYFEGRPQRWFNEVTYTDGDPIASPEQYEWNHGLGETVQAVIDAGLRVTALREHTELEWQGLPQMVEGPDGKFRLPEMPERVPLMFTLEAGR
jgi:SAM-dependent methyltransferase